MKGYLFFLGRWMLIGLIFLIGIYQINQYLFKRVHSDTFKDTKILIVGDSHFNGLHIDNAYHLGLDSEVYFTMYQKVEAISTIAKIEKVIISFSYINMSKNRFDDLLRTNDIQAYSIAKRNYPIASLYQLIEQSIYWKPLIKVLTKFSFTFNYQYLYNLLFKSKEMPFIRSTYELGSEGKDLAFLKEHQKKSKRKLKTNSRSYKRQITGKIERLFENDNNEIAVVNLHYLEKLLQICQVKGIKVWIVNTPLEAYYEKMIPEYIKIEFNNKITHFSENYNNIKYVNYMDFFKKSDFFRDEHHITGYGAALISEELQKELN